MFPKRLITNFGEKIFWGQSFKRLNNTLSLSALRKLPAEVLQRPDVHSQGAAPEGLPVPAGRPRGSGPGAALQGPAAQPGAGEQAGAGLDHTQPGGERGDHEMQACVQPCPLHLHPLPPSLTLLLFPLPSSSLPLFSPPLSPSSPPLSPG